MHSLFRSRNADFRDHVISHYDGLPEIGTVFAILVEKKYFRAIRTHSEVCAVYITFSHQSTDNNSTKLNISFRFNAVDAYFVPSYVDRHR